VRSPPGFGVGADPSRDARTGQIVRNGSDIRAEADEVLFWLAEARARTALETTECGAERDRVLTAAPQLTRIELRAMRSR